MPFISSSELCSRIKAMYRKPLYLNNPFQKYTRCPQFLQKVKSTNAVLSKHALYGKQMGHQVASFFDSLL